MAIREERNGNDLKILLEGELNTMTAPELSECLEPSLCEIDSLEIDMKNIEYIASSGIRVLMWAMKTLKADGKSFKITNCNDIVWETFEMTGLDDVFDISRA